ncbi:APC family permease [Bryobacter aggregatus]|uniref:APC family permease n=1 Tax=Bryobacter aggregatus TaxID=360054 RepID=UPI0004E16ABA|nr:amino acid permease [Bryobacter aggregatus]
MSEKFTLRRDLGLWGAAAIVVGTVIGSGVFVVPKRAVIATGSPDWVTLVWIVGGILSLAGALTYAELSSMMPEAGGEYVYLREAYGPFFAFIYGWTQFWVAKSGSIATLASGFLIYLSNFVPILEQTFATVPLPLGPNGAHLELKLGQLAAMGVILFLAGVNYFGVKAGGQLQIAVTIAKVGLLLGIVLLGLFSSQGSSVNFTTSVMPQPGGASGFFVALVAILWAYDGWNNVSMVSSEIKNPQRNLPLALIFGTLGVMAIYLLANTAYFYVLTSAEVAASDRVPAEMMRKLFGNTGANWVSVAAMISIFSALNGSILSGGRVPYAMAKDGLFFKKIAEVHPTYRSPAQSMLWLSLWSSVLVFSGQYDQLAACVIFASWILYGMTAASVIVLRHKRPDLPRPYKTLGYPVVPGLFVMAAMLLIFFTLKDQPRESMIGLTLIAAGIPFYWYWSRQKKM